MLFYIWLVCLFLQYLEVKYNYLDTKASIFTLIMILIFFCILLCPYQVFYKRARMELLVTMMNIFGSPFTCVRFKDFFLADIFTSLVKPFQDIVIGACFFSNKHWLENTEASCSWLGLGLIIMMVVPFYWRLMQCLKKYYETKDKFPHLVNAGKYMSSIAVVFLNLLNYYAESPSKMTWVLAYIFATLYAYIWDITMDWGLIRSNPNYPFLRQKILFPEKWYYFAMISNLLLRFAWTLTLFSSSFFSSSIFEMDVIIFALSIMEAYRRAQWSLFRVENENVNNYEHYRVFLEIPTLPDDLES
jgi:xenotropic and polytropic retrovirus receptor 1